MGGVVSVYHLWASDRKRDETATEFCCVHSQPTISFALLHVGGIRVGV